MPQLPKDIIALPEVWPERNDVVWTLLNVMTRTSLGVDRQALSAVLDLAQGRNPSGPFQVWDTYRFSNEDGLLADPSRLKRPVSAWGAPLSLSRDEFLAKLKKNHILIESEDEYRDVFGRKKSLLDHKRVGNLHDQLGSFLTLSLREDPAAWWINQKFTPDRTSVRDDNLYGVVQEQFLKRYFQGRIGKGMSAIDLGCGIGHYANMMASYGADTLGLDPDASYIEIARGNAPANARFEVCDVGTKGSLDKILAGSVDFAFMSDALQFYFVPIGKADPHTLEHFLAELKRVLKKGGSFTFMEPHPAFYQAPWLGDENRPFTIKTEYRNRVQGIIPTLQEYIQAFLANGFSLKWFEEVYAGPDQARTSTRAYRFASEFPLWVIYDFRMD
ncbi:MAG: class I SAM-dependent methyltransferase [Rhodospirillaceae bacterium]|nr:class I SAM-dependent methyltransferase [Rhodospirillaceae bacterium]